MAREQALAAVFWTIGVFVLAYSFVLARAVLDGVLAAMLLMLVWYARKLYRLRRLELQQRVDMSDDRATPSDDD
jgi:membrane-bound ClpP family serine protease